MYLTGKKPSFSMVFLSEANVVSAHQTINV